MDGVPDFFRLGVTDTCDLPLGAEFECVYAPEATTRRGWQRVTFRVVMHVSRGEQLRGYQEIGALDIDAAEVAWLWRAVSESAS